MHGSKNIKYQSIMPEFLNSCQDGMNAFICSRIEMKQDISAE